MGSSNDKKYIALFPTTKGDNASEDKKTKLTLPDLIPDVPKFGGMEKGEQKRMEMLLETKAMMGRGELSGEPEKELSGEKGKVDIGGPQRGNKEIRPEEMKPKAGKSKKGDAAEVQEDDDFFESD
jgi:hypothetical protein